VIATVTIINKMERLVLANPNISARELAKRLGFLEQKSVYYWLEKAGYKGLKDFRAKVLTRSSPITHKLSDKPSTKKDSLRWIPLFKDSGADTNMDLKDFIQQNLAEDGFCILVSGDYLLPWAGNNDVLLVDKVAQTRSGDLVIVEISRRIYLARCYRVGNNIVYVDANQPEKILNPDSVTGKLVFILKKSVGK
jgi:SOS-response transcriptional repressor LexA